MEWSSKLDFFEWVSIQKKIGCNEFESKANFANDIHGNNFNTVDFQLLPLYSYITDLHIKWKSHQIIKGQFICRISKKLCSYGKSSTLTLVFNFCASDILKVKSWLILWAKSDKSPD